MAEFKTEPSDHLTLANAFDAYMQVRELNAKKPELGIDLLKWCKVHFLDLEALEDARKARHKLGKTLGKLFDKSRAPPSDKTRVRKALAIVFASQAAIVDVANGQYRTTHTGVYGNIEPLSAALRQLNPKLAAALGVSFVKPQHVWVVYTKLELSGGATLMKTVTAVEGEWLAELPLFQDEKLPKKPNGEFRQPRVKVFLDSARATATASALSAMSL